jgi:hypothetical protein
MSSFLYFFPGDHSQPTKALLESHGLAYAFEPPRWAWSGCRAGPDRGPGLLVADPRHLSPERIRYSDAAQAWRRVPNSTAWIGHYQGELPGPEELRRGKQLDGYPCMLADGREWLVPIAREAAETDGRIEQRQALPRRYELDDAGAWQPGDVLPEYESLNDIAAAFCDAADGAQDGQFDFQDPGAAVRVLAHNYRLAAVEASLLGLFTHGGGETARVLLFCADFPGLWKLKKKQGADTSATSDGPAGSTGTTDPASPT